MKAAALVPDVSIVIPTRNRKLLLARAVESCGRAAGSSSFEVIVVDDGSTDGTRELVEERYPDVVLLADRPGGDRGRARNDGMARARGHFLKFLDDDDWLEPGTLAAEIASARAASADVVASGHRIVDGVKEVDRRMPPALDRGVDSILAGESVPNGAALYRRAALGNLRWRERDWILDDWRFFALAVLATRRVTRLEEVVVSWYPHAGAADAPYSPIEYATAFYGVLSEVETRLESTGELTPARRRRLAQYRYKQLRALCVGDRSAFEREVLKIRALDPAFRPLDEERQVWMRWLARALGFRRALLVHTLVKRAYRAYRPVATSAESPRAPRASKGPQLETAGRASASSGPGRHGD